MKPVTATFISIFFIFHFNLGYSDQNSLQNDIAKVSGDYSNGFKNISGEQVMGSLQTIEFESSVSLKEASRCPVIKYSSNTKDIYLREAEMLKSDNFEETSNKIQDNLQFTSTFFSRDRWYQCHF